MSESRPTLKATKKHLLEVAAFLLQKHGQENITSDLVLLESHVSKGSLYHHYEDFQDLVEDAQLYLYTQHVINTLEGLITFVRRNENPDDVRNEFQKLIRAPETVGSVFFREQKFEIAYAGSR
ncbi:MAG: TetR/AcrR family transcriptional regulator, partial [Actinomycetes bacterium]